MRIARILTAPLWLSLSTICQAQFHTNVITTPNSLTHAFSVDGSSQTSPTINLSAGVTNILLINTASVHPVVITTNLSVAMTSWYTFANPQDIFNGAMALRIPITGFPSKLYYYCPIHLFHGEIDLTGPVLPAPPRNQILSLQIGTNVVMTSTGTNTTWTMVPEFSSNLFGGIWGAVPSYTNTFANGTNTTVFNRLDPICGPNVYLRLRQQQ